MWFWVVVVSGFLSSIRQLLNRLLLKDKGDSLAFAFFYQAVGAFLILPFLFFGLKLPETFLPYFLLIIVIILDTLCIYLIMESYKHLEISLRTIIYQLRVFWVLVLSVLILGDSLSFGKILGISLVFGGISLAVFEKRRISRIQSIVARILGRKDLRARGMGVTLLASLLTSLELIAIKSSLKEFSIPFFMFVVFGSSAIIYLVRSPDLKKRTLVLLKSSQAGLAWMIGILGTISAFLSLWGISLVEVSKASPIFQSFAILTILGGIIFLKEKERVWAKILGGLLVVAGVVLVKGS